MTEGGEQQPQTPGAESAPKKTLVPEKHLAFKRSSFFETEDELNNFKGGLKDLSDPEREIGERILKLHRIMAGLPTSSLQGELEEIYKTAKDNNLPDDNELFVFAASVLSTEIESKMESSTSTEVTRAEEAKKDIVEALKEAMGSYNVSAERQREMFTEVEEAGVAVVDLPPLSSPFLEGLSSDEKTLWRARVALSNARSFKQAATSPDKLFPNSHVMNLTKTDLKSLYSMKGVLDAQAIYTVLATGLSQEHANLASFLNKIKFVREGGEVSPKSIFDIKSKDEEMIFRNGIRSYLKELSGLTDEEARNAELVAFNLFLISDIAEFKNTDVNNGGLGYTPSSEVYSIITNNATRNLLHPLEKALEERDKGRAWPPGDLGQWILAHKNLGPKQIEPFLPFTLGSVKDYSLLHNLEVPVRGKDGSIRKVVFLDYLREIAASNRDSSEVIDWMLLEGENPFFGYASKLGKKSLVWGALVNRQLPQGKTVTDLGNALTDLDIPDTTREILVYFFDERRTKPYFDPSREKFSPVWTGIDQGAYWFRWLRSYPHWFKDTKYKRGSLFAKIAYF
jgi:hypothetical protein